MHKLLKPYKSTAIPSFFNRACVRMRECLVLPAGHSSYQNPPFAILRNSNQGKSHKRVVRKPNYSTARILKSVEEILKDIQGHQPELEHQALESMVAKYEVCDSSPGSEDQCSNIPEKIDVATNTCHYLDEDVGIQNVPFTLETDVQATIIMDDASVQAVVATEDVGTETSKLVAGVGIMTDDMEVDTTPFCVEAIKEDDFLHWFYIIYAFNDLFQLSGTSNGYSLL